MNSDNITKKVQDFFRQKLKDFGSTPLGLDYNSQQAMEIRFDQLMKVVINPKQHFSIIDYGCGYGALIDYLLARKYQFIYHGIDFVTEMVDAGIKTHPESQTIHWYTQEDELPMTDYLIAGSIFNKKVDASDEEWKKIVLTTLDKMNSFCKEGFSFNMLTKYSDADRMRPDLFYADPCFFFDYCKRNFAKNVALLHDYKLYDFTLLIRKED